MKILIADDHDLVREGLKHALRVLARDVVFVEARNSDEVSRAVEQDMPLDLILLDLVMPGSGDLELLRRVCDRGTEVPVIVLSASDDPVTMRRALDCGASGFIPKITPHEVMLSAIRLVLAGGVYIPPAMMSPLLGIHAPAALVPPCTSPDMGIGATDITPPPPSPPPMPLNGVLTDRQREVLALLGQGLQNKQIARELELSEYTVKIHVGAIMSALGATNRTQAVVIAQQYGLTDG